MGGASGGHSSPLLGHTLSEHDRTAQSMAGSLMGGGAGGIPVLGLVTCRQGSSEHGRQPHGGWGWWHSSPWLGHMQAGQLRAWQAASWGVGLVAFQSLAWSHAGRTALSMAGSLMGGGAGGIPVLGLVTCRQDSSEHGRQPHGGWGW